MSSKSYEADGAIIRKLPVERENADGSVNISIGFPVCHLTEWCDEQGEVVAELLNRGEQFDGMLAALRKALNFLENTEGELGITLDSADAARDAIATAEALS